MILHTLGPAATDSAHAAAAYLSTHPQFTVQLHPSFTAIYDQLNHLAGDYLLIPASYQSPTGLSWGQLHYRTLAQLQLIDGFVFELAPMAVAHYQGRTTKLAYSHPATADLLRQFLPPEIQIKACSSKVVAANQFLLDGEYVLTSQELLPTKQAIKILKTIHTPMLWSVYQILPMKGSTS